jgi:predicted unusual protein kinase regulating ubiquinone biosynthesis (AarF/ABC1/UbiB family)
VKQSDGTKIPGGRVGRLARLFSTGVRTGASLLLDRKDGAGASAQAQRAAAALGTLRGLAAKLGQMASYVDGVVPETHRDVYESAMSGLRAAAPRSNSAEIRALIESELAAPLAELFESFDELPIASASIGQVHRARLKEAADRPAMEVAVKVQHPGIVTALESDLANASILEQMAGLLGSRRLNSQAMLETARARFREELDYTLEAERQTHFAKFHANDPTIRIPRVIAERSSKRVLTSEFVQGASFENAIAASAAERHAWAETLWRFVFKGNLLGGMFNADPHPGNYLFGAGGTVTFLDFGCVQVIPEDHRQMACVLHRAATRRDEPNFYSAVRKLLRTREGPLEELALRYIRLCFEPLFGSPYRITRAYATQLVDELRHMSQIALKTEERHLFTMPAEMLFMNRLQFGFYSVLARLDVAVNFAAIEAAFLSPS